MSIDVPLTLEEAREVVRLQHELGALRQALERVTDSATPAVIYGRVNDLLNERQDALIAIFQRARGGELAEVNARC